MLSIALVVKMGCTVSRVKQEEESLKDEVRELKEKLNELAVCAQHQNLGEQQV